MANRVMMLPIIARAARRGAAHRAGGLREAGLALGSSQWRTVWHVVLPTARRAFATALILGIAAAPARSRRAAQLGPVHLMNLDPLHSTMNSAAAVHLLRVRSGQPAYIVRGYGAAAYSSRSCSSCSSRHGGWPAREAADK